MVTRLTGNIRASNRDVRLGRAGRARRKSLSASEIAQFKGMLLAKRRELLGDISAMEREGTGDARELLSSEWEILRQIDEALARIQNGTYGICEATGTRITKARLRACPWAKYCIEYARRHDRPKAPMTPVCLWPEDEADEPGGPDQWELLRRA